MLGLKAILLVNILMAVSVCDLQFYLPDVEVTDASAIGVPDGALSCSVVTSELFPRFSINGDIPYNARTNTTGTFSGLVPGTYTLNCRTSSSCVREISVVIGVQKVYNPKYRLQYGSEKPNSPWLFRFDIEEKDFAGSVTDIKGGPSPVEIAHRGEALENPFEAIIPSQATVTIMCETNQQFIEFATYSERKYRGTWYVHDGSNYVQKWQGFLLPQGYSEVYSRNFNYPISIIFTDGLADLSKKTFSDVFKNDFFTRIKVLDGIIICLRKTGLNLQLWDSMNLYPSSMAHGSTDSFIDQLYFDPLTYQDKDGNFEDCFSVLKSLLTNLCSRVMQSNGVWMIENPTLKTAAFVPTRVIDPDGTILSASNVDFRIQLRGERAASPKLTFQNESPMMNVTEQFGIINITYNYGLKIKNNILVSGDFEDEDLDNGQLKNWQIEYTRFTNIDFPPLSARIMIDASKDHDRVLYNNFYLTKGDIPGSPDNKQQIILASLPIALHLPNTQPTKLRISFDIYTYPSSKDTYVEIDLSAQVNWTVGPTLITTTIRDDGAYDFGAADIYLLDGEYIRIYIDDHYAWKTVVLETIYDNALDIDGDFQLKFRIASNRLYDYASISDLRAVVTDVGNLRNNNRVRVYDSLLQAVRHYKYVISGDSDDGDKIIIPTTPTGYNGVWQLDKIVIPQVSTHESWLSYFMIDNVSVQYLPNDEEPIVSEESTDVLNTEIDSSIDLTLRHGDLPDDENYKSISRGWFSLADGTPTSDWKINKYAPPGPGFPTQPISLIQLIQQLYRAQYQIQRWKLSGDVDFRGIIPYMGFCIYETVTGRLYVQVAPNIKTKGAVCSIEIIEALLGTPVPDTDPSPDPDVEPPPSTKDFSPADFSTTDFFAS